MEPDKRRKEKREYLRAWFKNHPGRHIRYQAKYWCKKLAELEQKKSGG